MAYHPPVGDMDCTIVCSEEIQRRLNAKRDDINRTVAELRLRVRTEVEGRKKAMSDMMDWKVQVGRHPEAACAGALFIGIVAGRMLANNLMDDDNYEYIEQRPVAYSGQSHDGNGLDVERHAPRFAAASTFVKKRMGGAFSDVSDTLVQEATRAIKDTIVPSLIAAVVGKFAIDKAADHAEKTAEKTVVAEKNKL